MWPSAGVLVFPTTMAPAARSLPTWIESQAADRMVPTARPRVVGMPLASSRSLTAIGTPASGLVPPQQQPRVARMNFVSCEQCYGCGVV
jgi:hypothetical protein